MLHAYTCVTTPTCCVHSSPTRLVGSLRAHAEVCICLAPGLDEGDIILRFYAINGDEPEVLVAESSSWSAADANVITLELYTDIPRAEAVVFEVSTRAGLLAATDHKLITMSNAQLFFRLCVLLQDTWCLTNLQKPGARTRSCRRRCPLAYLLHPMSRLSEAIQLRRAHCGVRRCHIYSVSYYKKLLQCLYPRLAVSSAVNGVPCARSEQTDAPPWDRASP